MKNKKILDNQITVYQTSEGEINIEVLDVSSTTEDFSVVQVEGTGEVIPSNCLRNKIINLFTPPPMFRKTMSMVGL